MNPVQLINNGSNKQNKKQNIDQFFDEKYFIDVPVRHISIYQIDEGEKRREKKEGKRPVIGFQELQNG